MCYVPQVYYILFVSKVWENMTFEFRDMTGHKTELLGSAVGGGGRRRAGLHKRTCVDRPNWIDMFYIYVNDVPIALCGVLYGFGSVSEE